MGGTVNAIEQAGQVAEHHLISEKLGRESISASEVVKTAALSAVAAPVMSRAASVIESTVSRAMTKRGTSLTTQESVQGPGASPSKMAEPELKSVAAEASIDVTRARVEANIAASRKGRESSNFEEHVQREATARVASNQPVGNAQPSAPSSAGRPSAGSLSDLDFVQKIATKAESTGVRLGHGAAGTGPAQGIWKHDYAKRVLERYQRMTGEKIDLLAEKSYLGGVRATYGTAGSARPDVFNPVTGQIFDYKFVKSPGRGLSSAQRAKNVANVPSVSAQYEINP
ncbi:hypothetical protein [Paucibacter sp. XJ19-41]|uniref:hypothetical protein n=1 Tax=Paucibacter sp. XJ19-41 TaxID=2927824 RepID=UPI00234A65FC|nr:hypothetical protein [Paucibacter sp. XJ19-41]MDC6167877.1 hypothetical protein [Paucibacter sp. XJ19-41]